MGFFKNLFGNKSSDDTNNNVEYNIMKNIKLESNSKHQDTSKYQLIESDIYEDLTDEDDAKYRMTISYEMENSDKNSQYPLEDILDKYLMHVEDFFEKENKKSNRRKLELGGYLDNMKTAQEIIGKTVFNTDFKDENGDTRVLLKIK